MFANIEVTSDIELDLCHNTRIKSMHVSADQLSRFVLDNQGIDHFVKGEK